MEIFHKVNIFERYLMREIEEALTGSMVKESTCQCILGDKGDTGLIPRLGRSSREGHGNPLQRSLVGYSPWDCKESDINEHIHIPHYLLSQLCQIKLLDGKKERSGEWF